MNHDQLCLDVRYMVIEGRSESGKTTYIINLVNTIGYRYDRIYILYRNIQGIQHPNITFIQSTANISSDKSLDKSLDESFDKKILVIMLREFNFEVIHKYFVRSDIYIDRIISCQCIRDLE